MHLTSVDQQHQSIHPNDRRPDRVRQLAHLGLNQWSMFRFAYPRNLAFSASIAPAPNEIHAVYGSGFGQFSLD